MKSSEKKNTPDIADAIKDIGFKYATRSGYSLAVSDITVPAEKIRNYRLVPLQARDSSQRDFRRGLLTEQEQNERVIEIWQRTTNLVADAVKRRIWTRMATWPPRPSLARRKVDLARSRSSQECAA